MGGSPVRQSRTRTFESRQRWGLWSLALVFAVPLGLTATPLRAEATVPSVSCGSTITADAVLTADLRCPSGDGLTLGPGVRLDLGGHSLVGPGSIGVGIAAEGADSGAIEIVNGTVKNWGTGFQLTASAAPVRISDVDFKKANITLSYSSYPGTVDLTSITAVDSVITGELGPEITIVDSVLNRSPVSLFMASARITNSSLTASTLDTSAQGTITVDGSRLNGKNSVRLGSVSETAITITNSTVKNYSLPITGWYGGVTLQGTVFTDMKEGVVGNISSGLGSEGTAVISGNTFIRSGEVLHPQIPMILENNTFRNNAIAAIFSVAQTLPGDTPLPPGRAVGNVVTKSSGTGIRADSSGLVVGGNTATSNGEYGIFAPDAVDLGGNKAYRNKLGQCVGVSCEAR